MDIIEELKEERLARNKANAIEARLKSIKKIKRRRRTIAITAALSVVIAGVLSFTIGYFITSYKSSIGVSEPVATATPQAPALDSDDKREVNEDGYIIERITNANFAYPASFKPDKENKVYHLYLEDTEGDARIIVNKEITGLTASELIVKYRDSIKNAKAKDSLANALGYTITLTADGKTYHKKSFVKDGWELYYEISYSIDSTKQSEYEAHIEHMDNYFTVS